MSYCVNCGSTIENSQHAFCGICGNPTQNSSSANTERPATASSIASLAPSEALSPEEKKAKAKKWVNGYAIAGGSVAAAAIIPGGATAALFTLETTMVLHIGRIYRGAHFSKEDAVAVVGAAGFMGTVGLGSKVAIEGLTFFPVIGWAIKGGIAGSVIKALGEGIIKYFDSIEHHK
jgi:uncharacterized protein (DUF697 family)